MGVIVFELQGSPLNHCQLQVHVGVNRSSSNAKIFNQSELRSGIIESTLQVPAAEPLPGDDRPMHTF